MTPGTRSRAWKRADPARRRSGPLRSASCASTCSRTWRSGSSRPSSGSLGTAILSWVVGSLVRETFPDLAVEMAIAPATLIAAALAGVVALAVAPLVTLRRLRRMDVRSTLRVME